VNFRLPPGWNVVREVAVLKEQLNEALFIALEDTAAQIARQIDDLRASTKSNDPSIRLLLDVLEVIKP